MAAVINMDALNVMTITEHFDHTSGLLYILNTIGVMGNQCTCIVTHDSLDTMLALTEQYHDDVARFKEYLEDLNKRLGGSASIWGGCLPSIL